MNIVLDPELIARFWKLVDKNGPVPSHKPELGPCWVWTGSVGANGYGRMNLGQRGVRERSHRIAWMIINGEIPVGIHVLHRCDYPGCVNAEQHLFLGTQADNMADMADKARGRRSSFSDEQIRDMRESYAKGESQRSLGQRYGISQAMAHYIVSGKRAINLPVPSYEGRPPQVVRGQTHHNALLDEEKVRAIRKAHAEGMSVQDIANSFGVNWTTANKVIKRVTWKHVE